jgi:hypothetical protein
MEFDEAVGRLNTLVDELRDDMTENEVRPQDAFVEVYRLFMDDIRGEATRGITESASMCAMLAAAALVDRAQPRGYSELYDSVRSVCEADSQRPGT